MISARTARRDDATEVAELLARCEAADAFPPLSEYKALRVPVADGVRAVVVDDERGIRAVGVAAWHPARAGDAAGYWAAEIAVDPQQRTSEAYLNVLEALVATIGDAVSLWTFSDQQRMAAQAGGLVEVRALVLMERALPAQPAEFPPGVTVHSFVPGRDETDWLALNRRVFADHPEAAAIDTADLELRMAQPWFDPAGFLILIEDGEPLGYCWTKRHSAERGEIYMIGLVPEARGRGLARPLTRAGLDYLSLTGADTVILYAEATNQPAIGLYGSMGFATIRRVALYRKPVCRTVED